MKKPILVANWKNSPPSLDEAKDLLKELNKKAPLFKKLSLFVAPPFPYLSEVGARSKKIGSLAAQDMAAVSKSPVTGSVSADILKSFGVRLVIVGHSERRALGETSLQVSEKTKTALKAGIVPVVCVGETERDHEGEYFEFLREQIKDSLAGLNKQAVSSAFIAYEPVWAIGKSGKEALASADLAQAVIFIRKVLSDLYGRKTAEEVSILYGGSVDHTNAETLVKEGGIKGFLVGRASLKPKVMESIAGALIAK